LINDGVGDGVVVVSSKGCGGGRTAMLMNFLLTSGVVLSTLQSQIC